MNVSDRKIELRIMELTKQLRSIKEADAGVLNPNSYRAGAKWMRDEAQELVNLVELIRRLNSGHPTDEEFVNQVTEAALSVRIDHLKNS